MAQKIIIDCDPGLDDAVAILMALASPELEVMGITTNVGNVSLQKTQANARRLCELADRTDVPVFAGCPRSMFGTFTPDHIDESTYTAADVHGDTGLGAVNLPEPKMPLQSEHAVNFIIRTIEENPGEVVMVCTGALTNMAMALVMAPQIITKIKKLVIMGGAIGLGNITPAAEYNFFCDPHAAHIVFTAQVPIVMFGLDVTRQTQTTQDWLNVIKDQDSKVSRALVEMLEYSLRPGAYVEPGSEATGKVLHDVNCIAYLLTPKIYEGREVFVEIDSAPGINTGRSTVDWYSKSGHKPNALVMNKVDSAAFFDLLTERIARYQIEINQIEAHK